MKAKKKNPRSIAFLLAHRSALSLEEVVYLFISPLNMDNSGQFIPVHVPKAAPAIPSGIYNENIFSLKVKVLSDCPMIISIKLNNDLPFCSTKKK